jgi:hypothetical protein
MEDALLKNAVFPFATIKLHQVERMGIIAGCGLNYLEPSANYAIAPNYSARGIVNGVNLCSQGQCTNASPIILIVLALRTAA